MNGPEHYRKAEDIIAKVETGKVTADYAHRLLRQAQVHATLAQTMATVNAGVANDPEEAVGDLAAWGEAARATPTPIPDPEPGAPQIW